MKTNLQWTEVSSPPPPEKNTLKGNSLLARYFLTSGKKQKWNKPRKSVSLSGLFVVQLKTKNWQLVVSFQGSEVRSTEEKSICTKW